MKKPVKQQEKKAIREKKKKLLTLTVLVVVVTALIMGIWLLRRSRPGGRVEDYNMYATVTAFSAGKIGQQDVLILHTIERTREGDSVAEFYIYRLPDGAKMQDYFGMTTDDVSKSLEQLGTATCTFVDDNPAAVHDLNALFLR